MTPPAPSTGPPVAQIGPWRLQTLLGSGGISDVWSATGTDGDSAAVKVLREPESSEQDVGRFLREGRLLSTLCGAGLPRCMGYGAAPVPHIVMESLEGHTLEALLIEQGALSVDLVVTMAEKLLDVLSHLHRHGVVHRDIKPSNLFWTKDGELKVLDLGLARCADPSATTTLGDVLGTRAYMAPEQLVGAELDLRCDLYAVGVTLYELLSGRLPVAAASADEQLEKMRNGEREPLSVYLPDIPSEVSRTIERLMAWDPSRRPQTAAIAKVLVLGGIPGVALQSARMVGRAAAVGALEAALDARMTVLVLGGAGSGVLRVSAHAHARARERGFDVIGLRVGSSRGGLVDGLAMQLGAFFGHVPARVPEVASCLDQLAGEGPILLLVDGLDRVGPGAREDFVRILQSVAPLPVVITAERDCPEVPGHRVALRGLSARETEQLVGDLLGASGCPAGLGPVLQRASNGLPGFVTLSVRELVETGALWTHGVDEQGSSRWLLDRRAPVAPTIGLARLYGRSLAQLPGPARRLLETLAVSEEPTALDAALSAAGVLRSEAVPPVMDATLIYLEAHPDGERVGLRHPGMGALLLRQLPADRTAALHAGLARALEASSDAVWLEPRIRWHRAHGLQGEGAVHALYALGDDLARRGQHGTAIDVLDVALQHCEDEDWSARVQLARGIGLGALCRWEEAQAALQEARDRGPVAVSMEASIWLSEICAAQGQIDMAVAELSRVVDANDATLDASVVVHGLVQAAEVRRRAGETDEALGMLRRASAVATLEDDQGLNLRVDAALANLLVERGRVLEGRKKMVAYADHLRFTGRGHLLVPVLYRLSVANRRFGFVGGAMDALDEAVDVCRYAQRPYDRALERIGRASVLLAVGDHAQAESTLAEAGIETDEDCPCALRLAYWDVQLDLRLATDDRASALAVAQLAEAEATRAGHGSDAAFFLGVMGVLTADGEAIDDALEQLSASGDRRLVARLLLAGAQMGQDPEVFSSAEAEARQSGDRFLMLEVLWRVGGERHREEAGSLCRHVFSHLPDGMAATFRSRPMVDWAMSTVHPDPVDAPVG